VRVVNPPPGTPAYVRQRLSDGQICDGGSVYNQVIVMTASLLGFIVAAIAIFGLARCWPQDCRGTKGS
jgi:hypothetical protein